MRFCIPLCFLGGTVTLTADEMAHFADFGGPVQQLPLSQLYWVGLPASCEFSPPMATEVDLPKLGGPIAQMPLSQLWWLGVPAPAPPPPAPPPPPPAQRHRFFSSDSEDDAQEATNNNNSITNKKCSNRSGDIKIVMKKMVRPIGQN